MKPDSRVSVVMATRNRVDEALATLRRLRELPERPRLVVVDNGSSDGTAQAIEHELPDVVIIALGENRGGAARNVGVDACTTPYVAFADDDSWWAPGSLARAADALDEHPRLAAVSARVLVGPEELEDPVCRELERSPLPAPPGLPGPAILGFLACGVVVRRAAYRAVGGFDARMMIGGEEELLAADLAGNGWTICYLRELTVHHHPSASRSDAERRRTKTRNALWFAWLRRPAAIAAARTARMLGRAARDPAAARGVLDAVRAGPGVLRRRRVVPPEVERSLRLLDAEAG